MKTVVIWWMGKQVFVLDLLENHLLSCVPLSFSGITYVVLWDGSFSRAGIMFTKIGWNNSQSRVPVVV